MQDPTVTLDNKQVVFCC